jgi:hypothetical protein
MKAVIRTEMEETTSCNRATETETYPRMMRSIEERQEIPKGETAVMPVGEMRKRCRVRNLAAEHRQKRKEKPGEKVDPAGSRLSPAGRYPAVQGWHDTGKTSSGKIGSRTRQNEELRNDERTEKDCGKAQNVKMA